MDRLSSSEFRKRYASLADRTEVTVNGHVIGEWVPASPLILGMVMHADGTTEGTAFDDRNSQTLPTEPGFNTRPFTPVPKKGK